MICGICGSPATPPLCDVDQRHRRLRTGEWIDLGRHGPSTARYLEPPLDTGRRTGAAPTLEELDKETD